ncbi:hypothetical protein D3C72_1601850 [compost metagenome]
MVRMCSARVELMWSIIAARVVDLPEPVGPVTSTMPRGLWVSSWMIGGMFMSSSLGALELIVRRTAAKAPLLLNAFTRKRPRPTTPYEQSSSKVCSSCLRCSLERIEKIRRWVSSGVMGS